MSRWHHAHHFHHHHHHHHQQPRRSNHSLPGLYKSTPTSPELPEPPSIADRRVHSSLAAGGNSFASSAPKTSSGSGNGNGNGNGSGGNGSSGGTLPTSTTSDTTLPITLGVIIPSVCAFIIFFVIWMRNRRKQKIEDANDKHASLDFGLGETRRQLKKGGKGMEMTGNSSANSMLRLNRGLSMDLGNPYVLPGELTDLADPRPSFHSLSRSTHDGEDPYRPVEFVMSSSRSFQGSRPGSRKDNASEFSDRSNWTSPTLQQPASNPQQLSLSPQHSSQLSPNLNRPFRKPVPGVESGAGSPESESPPSMTTATMTTTTTTATATTAATSPPPTVLRKPLALPKDDSIPRKSVEQSKTLSPVELPAETMPDLPAELPSNQPVLPMFNFDYEPVELAAPEPAATVTPKSQIQRKEISQAEKAPVIENSIPPRGDSILRRGDSLHPPTDAYAPRDSSRAPTQTSRSPTIPSRESSRVPTITSGPTSRVPTMTTAEFTPSDYDMQRYDDEATYADVLGIVQEPSRDLQHGQDDYSEYGQHDGYLATNSFNEYGRPLSASFRPLPPDDPSDTNPEQRANRIRSFYKEYFDDKYDPRRTQIAPPGEYYEDYGQEFLNGAAVWDPDNGQFIVHHAPYAEPIGRRAMTPPPRAPPRFMGGHSYTGSSVSQQYYGPGQRRLRAYSSASGPMGYGQRQPRRPAKPPKALTNLPTPHLLKDDSAIFNAADFAPPASFRERVQGRPESPFKDKRPYSPTVRPYTPLASPYHELNAMPSPHQLRKSGTFTSLDFAPPARYKHGDSASDAGSIRSGRSNYSNLQLASLRNGAYRVSRIPKEMVGTKNDFAQALRPSWQQRDV